MEAIVRPLAMQLGLHGRMVRKFLKLLPDKAAFKANDNVANPPLWQLVHIIEARSFFPDPGARHHAAQLVELDTGHRLRCASAPRGHAQKASRR